MNHACPFLVHSKHLYCYTLNVSNACFHQHISSTVLLHTMCIYSFSHALLILSCTHLAHNPHLCYTLEVFSSHLLLGSVNQVNHCQYYQQCHQLSSSSLPFFQHAFLVGCPFIAETEACSDKGTCKHRSWNMSAPSHFLTLPDKYVCITHVDTFTYQCLHTPFSSDMASSCELLPCRESK